MHKKIIPIHKNQHPSTKTREEEQQEKQHVYLIASGENTQAGLADYLKEEAERVRTVALLMEVAESICREEPGHSKTDEGKKETEKSAHP